MQINQNQNKMKHYNVNFTKKDDLISSFQFHANSLKEARKIAQSYKRLESLNGCVATIKSIKSPKVYSVRIVKGEQIISSFSVVADTLLIARAEATRQKWIRCIKRGTVNVCIEK